MGLELPPLFAAGSDRAAVRVTEFFCAHIQNPNTRRAYHRAAMAFSAFCEAGGLTHFRDVQPMHVAAWVQSQATSFKRPTIKQRLAAIRMLFDWLVVGQVAPTNPASSVRGPKHTVRRGKTPVLDPTTTRRLLDSIESESVMGRRDRALIGLMIYTFARIGAALCMTIEDYFMDGHGPSICLREKGGKVHQMPVNDALRPLLDDYLDLGGLRDSTGPLFRSIQGRSGRLTMRPMRQSDAWKMLQRRAAAAGLKVRISNHTFRATGITTYLSAGGSMEVAQRMANHESPRTTALYDRRADIVTRREVELVRI